MVPYYGSDQNQNIKLPVEQLYLNPTQSDKIEIFFLKKSKYFEWKIKKFNLRVYNNNA